jgi:putative Holliday junction resolvase
VAAILGIDFGERRIGIAVSDSEGILATPLDTIDTRKQRDSFAIIKDYVEEYSAEVVVIGYPLHTNGMAGEKVAAVELFIEQLVKRCPEVKIIRQDERYSSSDAQVLIRSSGKRNGKKPVDKSLIDRMAAAIILQEFIDTEKNSHSVKSAVILTTLLFFITLFASCGDTVRYSSTREIPFAPKLLELAPGTKNDSLPAIIVKFSYEDTLPATIRIESADDDAVFGLSVYNVPITITTYADPVPTASNAMYLSERFYRLFAASLKDNLSPSSDTLSILLLDRHPQIDSVIVRGQDPVVYYTVFGQLGVTCRLAITMGDSAIKEVLLPTTIFSATTSLVKEWTETPVDSLRVWAARAGRGRRPYGIRVIVELPARGTTAYGIAAASLHIPIQ